MSTLNPPSKKELRDFGLITGALLSLLFGLVLPYLRSHRYPLWPWVLSAALIAPALLRPQLLKYTFAAWNRLGMVLGWLNSTIVLAVIFYVVIVPTGFLMRMLGRDPMARNFDPEAASYRVSSSKTSVEGMERPF